MDGSYFSLDALLEDQSRVPVTFLVDVPEIGQILDPSSTTTRIPAGTKAEIPFWLAEVLVQREMAILEVPKAYGPRMQARLRQEASVVNLNNMTPYYYNIGLRLTKLLDGNLQMSSTLLRAFTSRYGDILSNCRKPSAANSDFMKKLTIEEQKLFIAGKDAVEQNKRWKKCSDELLKAAPVMNELRPYKRIRNMYQESE